MSHTTVSTWLINDWDTTHHSKSTLEDRSWSLPVGQPTISRLVLVASGDTGRILNGVRYPHGSTKLLENVEIACDRKAYSARPSTRYKTLPVR